MYSIIVNSIDPEKLKRFKNNIEQVMGHTSWELVHIPDAKSMCEGYNRGLKNSKGKYLIFCHDDIEFVSEDISGVLEYCFKNTDVFGVLGTRLLIRHDFPASGIPNVIGLLVKREVTQPAYSIEYEGLEGILMSGIQALDGMLIGCSREVASLLKWDDINFLGWHGYDIDFSYRAFRAGFHVAVCGVLPIIHHTNSTFSAPEVRNTASILYEKHPMIKKITSNRINIQSVTNSSYGHKDFEAVMNFLRENYSQMIANNAMVRSEVILNTLKELI